MAPKRKWRKNSGRGVKGSALKEIRMVETSSEDDSDFIGFIEYDTKRNRSGIVTALPRFARPGRDWIHHERLASAVRPVSHRSGTVTAQIFY